MKKILLAGVAVSALLIAQPSYAADMPVRPLLKAPPLAPVFSWTGCFVGAQVGWGWQRNHITQHSTVSASFTATTTFFADGHTDASGAVFGGQVGCDYQVSNQFVIGAQATFLAADINGQGQDPWNALGGTPPLFNTNGYISSKTNYIGSATGRLGFTPFSPTVLLYVRGGFAWTQTHFDLTHADLNFNQGNNAALYDLNFHGWTIGGGFEWAFKDNWTLFTEFNYYRFGTDTITGSPYSACTNTSTIGPCFRAFSSGDVLSVQPSISTITVGLNYRFGMR